MINIFDWSYEVDRNFVRIEFSCPIKGKLQSAIKKFNGQLMPVKNQPNEFFVKFKNATIADEFLKFALEQHPNCFHLNNKWDVNISSENTLSFSTMKEGLNSISDLSKILNSFLDDCNTISNLTRNQLTDIQVNADTTLCYITFKINFTTGVESQNFLKDFIKFKA